MTCSGNNCEIYSAETTACLLRKRLTAGREKFSIKNKSQRARRRLSGVLRAPLFAHFLLSNLLLFDQRRNARFVTGNNFYRIKTNVFFRTVVLIFVIFFFFHLFCLSDGQKRRCTRAYAQTWCVCIYIHTYVCMYVYGGKEGANRHSCGLVAYGDVSRWRETTRLRQLVCFIPYRQNSRQILHVEVDKCRFGRCPYNSGFWKYCHRPSSPPYIHNSNGEWV